MRWRPNQGSTTAWKRSGWVRRTQWSAPSTTAVSTSGFPHDWSAAHSWGSQMTSPVRQSDNSTAIANRSPITSIVPSRTYRTDKAGIIHCTIGRASFSVEALQKNLSALIEALQKAKPAASKGHYLKKVSLSSTMGAGVRVDQASLSAQA